MSAENFKDIQQQFAGHIRDPEHVALRDDVEDRRMNIYRELFYNNIEGFVSNAFPVLRKFYNDVDWHAMVRSFMVQHKAHSPYFLEISQEFLQYFQNQHVMRDCDPSFAIELSHYEWVELALTVADEDTCLDNIDANGDLMQGQPVCSSLAWNLSYQWPVHQLSADSHSGRESTPQQTTHIVVYRDRQDKVRFVVINAVTAVLLNIFDEQPELTGQQACEMIAQQMQHPNPEVVIRGGQQALADLQEKGILLGTRL
jgi:hypothetical protein